MDLIASERFAYKSGWLEPEIGYIAILMFLFICSAISTSTMERFEPEEYEALKKTYKGKEIPEYLYFNKGL